MRHIEVTRGWRTAQTLVLLCAVLQFACDAMTFVHGVVTDREGRPIPGASVRLAYPDGRTANEVRSKDDGAYVISTTHGWLRGMFRLTVTAPGYLPFEAEFRANTRSKCDVQMKRAPAR
jgi:hypothetical protein